MSKDSLETIRILPGMCRLMGLEMEDVYEKTKRILLTRQNMAWTVVDFTDDADEYIYYYRADELEQALEWIKTYFYSDEKGNGEENENLMILWESGLMSRLFRETMDKLLVFRKVGSIYHTLISKRFLEETVTSVKDLEDQLGICRSTYFARLKEAVVAFGLAFCRVTRTFMLEEDHYEKEE